MENQHTSHQAPMAYSTLDSLFGTYIGPPAPPPCVVGTGSSSGAQAWPPARRNFVSTIAPSPYLSPYEILKWQPWDGATTTAAAAATASVLAAGATPVPTTRPRNLRSKYVY